MAKVVELNGMTIKVIDSQEKDAFLTQDDKDMDIRATAAVRAALNKAKICGKPIARYDIVTHRVFIEYVDGTIKYY